MNISTPRADISKPSTEINTSNSQGEFEKTARFGEEGPRMALKKGNSASALPNPIHTSPVAAAVLSAATSSTPPPPTTESKWITLVEDQDAKVFTFGTCMALTDLRGDGRWALIAGELSQSSGEVRLRALDGNYTPSNSFHEFYC